MDWTSGFSGSAGSRFRGDARSRVLVVEDNVDIAGFMTLLLQHFGFDVRTLFDGREALATARSFRPHFVLLDIGLPGMDGYQVAEQIRDDPDLKDIVIIAISAYSPDTDRGRSGTACFNHYLTKPVNMETLLPLLVRN
jgi:two-component system CheB/CheR fusion protein